MKKRKKKKRLDSNFSMISPVVDFNDEHNCYVKSNGEVIDFIKIIPINVSVDPASEIVLDNMILYDRFLKTFPYPFNEIVMNFPTDVSSQVDYYKKKIKECNNPLRKDMLLRDMQQLENLGTNDSEKNYIYMFHGKDFDELKKIEETFMSYYPRTKYQFLSRKERDIIIEKMLDITSVLSDY
ncbi:hypothetical protein [Anaerofustis butyriciformans]|uniref:hypothetical protein n=1 Tax=Anaerofustis butyriciformans TaxID=3108533 RepID=UPI002E30D7EC|nr:hypothetical protein [Anaerofustis sp. HA2171]